MEKNTNVATTSSVPTLTRAFPSNSPIRESTAASFEENGSHVTNTTGSVTLVSECQSPDHLLETSTMTSSSDAGGTDPVVDSSLQRSDNTMDLPRHIETPKNFHSTTSSSTIATAAVEMNGMKIPNKSEKLTEEIDGPNHHHQQQQQHPLPPPAPKGNDSATVLHNEAKAQSNNCTQSLSDKKSVIPMMDSKAAAQVETVTLATTEAAVKQELTSIPQEVQDPVPDTSNKTKHLSKEEATDEIGKTPGSSPGFPSGSSPRMLKKYRRVQIGTRVSVYWDGEDTFFEGTITAERPGKKKRFYLEYDDGDEEWINLRKHTWRLLSGGRPKRKKTNETLVAPETRKDSQDQAETVVVPEKRKESQHQHENMAKAVEVPSEVEAEPAKETPLKKVESSNCKDWIHDDQWVSGGAKKSDSDSETDEEEIMHFARKMLGVPKAPLKVSEEPPPDFGWDDLLSSGIHIPISEKVKLGRRRNRTELNKDNEDVAEAKRDSTKKRRKKLTCRLRIKAKASTPLPEAASEETKEIVTPAPMTVDDSEEANRRKREEARTLTVEEAKAILGEEDFDLPCSSHWVRRSARMPSRSVLNTPKFKQLIEKLKMNDPDMVVLKMKKYLSDPNCPQVCIDTVLDALEENTNCQSLYIQNFNEGMRDEQVLRLVQILQKPSCNIWCLNIGETYNVKMTTWKAFARGLKDTKITHMYASEHTISSDLKEKIRLTIRENRKKHTMHIDPENLDVIVKVRYHKLGHSQTIQVGVPCNYPQPFSLIPAMFLFLAIPSAPIVGGIQSMPRFFVRTYIAKDTLTSWKTKTR
jgi:hypothetical protein